MAEKEKSIIPGALLILVGLFLLLHQLDLVYLRWRHLYPILMLGFSALFFASIIYKRDKGAIFPGMVLLVLGLFFFLRNFDFFEFGYYFYSFEYYWPIFLVAFGLGFVALYVVRQDDWGVLIPGTILLFLGTLFFLRSAGYFFWWRLADFWPVILIIIGLSIVFSNLRKRHQ